MDTRNYCAYNLTKDAFLSLKVAIADPVLEPLRVLEVLVDGLDVDSESALWLTPLAASPQLPRLFPFDIAYLDQNNRIIEALSVAPGMVLPPFRNQFSSALILPERTLSERQTLTGDEVRICNDEDMAAQLKAIYAASSPDPIASADPFPSDPLPSSAPFPDHQEAPLYPSSGLHVPLETIPIEVTRNVESPYELFPNPLAFVPAVTAQALRSAELLMLEPPPIPKPPLAAIPVAASETSVDLPKEVPVSAPAVAAQEAASTIEVHAAAPIYSPPLIVLPIDAQFIAISEESAQRPALALSATPIPPNRSVQTTLSLATGWQISTPETAISDHTEKPEKKPSKKRPPASASQPRSKVAPQPPVEEAPSPAVAIPSPIPDSHSEKQTEQLETPSNSDLSASAIPSAPAHLAHSAEHSSVRAEETPVEIPAPAPEQPIQSAIKGSSNPVSPEPRQWESPLSADLSAPANQGSAASVTEDPIAATPEPAPEEPRPFVPSPIHSDEKNANPTQPQVPAEQDFATRNSNQLPPEVQAVIHEITEKERARERQKREEKERQQEKRKVKTKKASEKGEPLSLIAKQEKKEPIPIQAKPLPQQGEPATGQRASFAERILHWLDDGGRHHRRSPRITSPGLVAFYWSGGSPKPHHVVNISDTGFYLLTEELWSPQTMLRITLQRPDKEEGSPKHSITVLARVVRIGPDGVGHEFVMTESLKRKSFDLLPDKGTDSKALKRFLQPLR